MPIRTFETHTPVIDGSAYVDPTALVIGQVEIGADSSLWPNVVARGDIHHIKIGASTNIQDGSVLHVTHDSEFAPGGHPVEIGHAVTVGHMVVLHGCTIEDNCLIGMGSMVMDGARVQTGAMLGAGSLVPPGKVLDGGWLWVGRPARPVRELTEQETLFLEYSARHYVRLKDRHLAGSD
ncbi:MAG: gamma carbonic anhydrase family protein [Gammaproteobacteria bacterium]|nr:gamma carbonic anhydrase family protein [Gammaproteobacteria bacterium]